MRIILKAKINFNGTLNLKNLSELNNIRININNINKIDLLYKNKKKCLKEIFDVKITKNSSPENIYEIYGCNSFCNYLGFNLKKDIFNVNSNLGSYTGLKMAGGTININGSVKDFLGAEMTGGFINVKKNARDYVGSSMYGKKLGMNGGEILINGDSGNYTASNMRRGMIIIKGSCGNFTSFKMISGSVLIYKNVGANFGISMKRGSIFLMKPIKKIKRNFTYSGQVQSNFFCYLGCYLRNKFSINFKSYTFIRYFGDRSVDGIGEILLKK